MPAERSRRTPIPGGLSNLRPASIGVPRLLDHPPAADDLLARDDNSKGDGGFLQLRLRRLLPRAFVGAQRPDDALHLRLKFLRVLPPTGKVGGQARADGLRLPAFPLE